MVYQINMIVGGGNYENLRYKLYSIFDFIKNSHKSSSLESQDILKIKKLTYCNFRFI